MNCDLEGCFGSVAFEIIDDDGSVVGFQCESHAIATAENSNGELRLRDRTRIQGEHNVRSL